MGIGEKIYILGAAIWSIYGIYFFVRIISGEEK